MQQPGSTTPTTTKAAEDGNTPVNAAFSGSTPPRFLRRRDVLARTGMSRTKMYQLIRAGTFPKQVPLGDGRAVRWVESEVSAWIAECVLSNRDGKVARHLLGDPAELLGELVEENSPLLERFVRQDSALMARLQASNATTTTPAPIIRKPQILVEIVRFETELRLSPSEKKAARARFGISGKIGKKRLAILTAYHESLHAELSAPQD